MNEMEKGEYVEPELIKHESPMLALEASDNDDPEDGNGSLVLLISLLACYMQRYLPRSHRRY
jgi:hypothetical protein